VFCHERHESLLVAGTQTLQKYLLLHLWSETYRSAYELTASATVFDLTTS
jgi:hypothetical protein